MERAPLCAAFHTSQPLSCQVWLSGPGCRPSCASLACDTWRWVFFCLSFLKTKDQGNFRTITGHKSKQWDAGLWRSSQKHGAVTRLRSPGDRSDCKNASVIKIFFSHPSVLSVNHGEKQKKNKKKSTCHKISILQRENLRVCTTVHHVNTAV